MLLGILLFLIFLNYSISSLQSSLMVGNIFLGEWETANQVEDRFDHGGVDLQLGEADVLKRSVTIENLG